MLRVRIGSILAEFPRKFPFAWRLRRSFCHETTSHCREHRPDKGELGPETRDGDAGQSSRAGPPPNSTPAICRRTSLLCSSWSSFAAVHGWSPGLPRNPLAAVAGSSAESHSMRDGGRVNARERKPETEGDRSCLFYTACWEKCLPAARARVEIAGRRHGSQVGGPTTEQMEPRLMMSAPHLTATPYSTTEMALVWTTVPGAMDDAVDYRTVGGAGEPSPRCRLSTPWTATTSRLPAC